MNLNWFRRLGHAPKALEDLDIRDTPGPSPWYLKHPRTALPSTRGALTWGEVGKGYEGLSVLCDPSNHPLLILDFQCYVQRFLGHRFMVWHENVEGISELSLQIFDADRLEPIPNLLEACAALRNRKAGIYASEAGHVSGARISRARDAGWHQQAFPDELQEVREIPMLVHSHFGDRVYNAWDVITLQLWLIYPSEGRFRTIWQDWYNKGAYDFGYQWPTRVARTSSGRIVGEGFRIGAFELDDNLSDVRVWLTTNPFGDR